MKRLPVIVKTSEFGVEEEAVALINVMFVESVVEVDEFTEITMCSGDFHHTHMSAKEVLEWLLS